MAEKGPITNWLNDIEDDARAEHVTHRFIADKSTSIVIQRKGVSLAAQTVRIELTRIQPDKDVGPAAREPNANALLIGYKGHPTIADTDVQAGDRFVADGMRFEVRFIFPETPGAIQAWLEPMQ
jgi:hypothetical protein